MCLVDCEYRKCELGRVRKQTAARGEDRKSKADTPWQHRASVVATAKRRLVRSKTSSEAEPGLQPAPKADSRPTLPIASPTRSRSEILIVTSGLSGAFSSALRIATRPRFCIGETQVIAQTTASAHCSRLACTKTSARHAHLYIQVPPRLFPLLVADFEQVDGPDCAQELLLGRRGRVVEDSGDQGHYARRLEPGHDDGRVGQSGLDRPIRAQ